MTEIRSPLRVQVGQWIRPATPVKLATLLVILEAMPESARRDALFRQLLDAAYEKGSAINKAATLEFEAAVDPADNTRQWLLRAIQASRVDTGTAS